MSKIYCLNCGNEIDSETKFCPSCGAANTQYAAPVVDAVVNEAGSASPAPAVSLEKPAEPVAQGASQTLDQAVESASQAFEQPAPEPAVTGYTPENIAPQPIPQPQPQYQNPYSNTTQQSFSQPVQQPYNANNAAGPNGGAEPSKALAIVSLVLGIISLVCCCWAAGFGGAIFSIAAVVCGVIAIVKKLGGKGMAIAGVICGGIALLLSIIMGIVSLAGGGSWAEDYLEENYPEIYEQFEDSF